MLPHSKAAESSNGVFSMFISNVESPSLELRLRFFATVRDIDWDIASYLNPQSIAWIDEQAKPLSWTKEGEIYRSEFKVKVPPMETVNPRIVIKDYLFPPEFAKEAKAKQLANFSDLMGFWDLSLPRKKVKQGGKTVEVPQVPRPARLLVSAETTYDWYDLNIPLNDSFEMPMTLAQGKAEHWIESE